MSNPFARKPRHATSAVGPCAAALLLATAVPAQAYVYFGSQRWNSTATDGGGLQFGDATTLTWSLVPDGTDWSFNQNSRLIARLDEIYGVTNGDTDYAARPWFSVFTDTFNRYSQLSGLSYVYQPTDDGAALGANGVLGRRGDVRIGGTGIGGAAVGVNGGPGDGDMTLRVDTNYFNNRNNLVQTIMHEHGHGVGLNHVRSPTPFLMDPVIQPQFFGPQLDDLRGIQRTYGDVFEKNGGNDDHAAATPLTLVNGKAAIGTDGGTDIRIGRGETDFVSIDNPTDTDFFRFTVKAPSLLDAVLDPLGTIYQWRPDVDGEELRTIDTTDDLNLTLAIFGTDGATSLGLSNSGGFGVSESLTGLLLPTAGTYYARITGGGAQQMQFYGLSLTATAVVPEPAGLALLALGGLALRRRRVV